MRVKWISILCIIILSLLITPTRVVVAKDSFESDIISMSVAKRVADFYVAGYAKTIESWQDAKAGEATEFYTEDNISAYEFKVVKQGQEVGYIIISARTDWSPVLEFGCGGGPSTRLN